MSMNRLDVLFADGCESCRRKIKVAGDVGKYAFGFAAYISICRGDAEKTFCDRGEKLRFSRIKAAYLLCIVFDGGGVGAGKSEELANFTTDAAIDWKGLAEGDIFIFGNRTIDTGDTGGKRNDGKGER